MAKEACDTGRVTINGRPAVAGDKVDPTKDIVRIGRQTIEPQNKLYLAMYKPRNVLTTLNDPQGRPCIQDYIPSIYKGTFPTGRLDYDASGLLLLTNDGELANSIHHPNFSLPKEYIVGVTPRASNEQLEQMAAGVILDGRKTRPAEIIRLGGDRNSSKLKIVLRQGLKNQIKRTAKTVGLKVTSIKRVAVGPVVLKGMQPGEIRPLRRGEIAELYKMLEKQKKT